MNELIKEKQTSEIAPVEQIIDAHKYLKDFIAKFDNAKRGGIHDFMELALFNMISSSIKEIDKYLSVGHYEVNATEIMHITLDCYQKVLDGIKRNLGEMKQVNFK
jgi:hypothetical protein